MKLCSRAVVQSFPRERYPPWRGQGEVLGIHPLPPASGGHHQSNILNP